MKKYVALFILVAAGAGAAWVVAGCAPGPMIEFIEPVAVGQVGELVMTIDTPGGELSLLEVTLEQGGETLQVFNLADPRRCVRACTRRRGSLGAQAADWQATV